MDQSVETNPKPLRWKLFNLIYVFFYFPEWFWRTPTAIDIGALVIALCVFVPLHFWAFERSGREVMAPMFAMEGIALALSPFSGYHGVFHIYACVQAGFMRPGKLAVRWIIGLTIFYAAFTFLSTNDGWQWFNSAFALVFGVVTGISCISAAEGYERMRILKRSQHVERQHARLAERERIAHDLHDVLGHTLTMVALKSEVASKLVERDPQRAREEIQAVAEAARAALADIRETVYDMSVTTLDTELALAKHALADAGITLTVTGELPELDARQSKALGLSVREATTNIVRHARATHASVTINRAGDALEVSISDDGQAQTDTIEEGSGLSGLRRRVREVGGEASVRVDNGLCISIRLPVNEAPLGAT
ncbi:MAG: sensor histidine kinase [Pseudomonadota bacterium]